jgi:hypothetical protein
VSLCDCHLGNNVMFIRFFFLLCFLLPTKVLAAGDTAVVSRAVDFLVARGGWEHIKQYHDVRSVKVDGCKLSFVLFPSDFWPAEAKGIRKAVYEVDFNKANWREGEVNDAGRFMFDYGTNPLVNKTKNYYSVTGKKGFAKVTVTPPNSHKHPHSENPLGPRYTWLSLLFPFFMVNSNESEIVFGNVAIIHDRAMRAFRDLATQCREGSSYY